MSDAFKAPSVWVPPLVMVAALVFVMTMVYFGSVVDPTGHLHGLPVAVVNEDAGASAGSRHVDFGRQVVAGLEGTPKVASRLALGNDELATAKDRMNIGKEYATVVIPPGFTASLLAIDDRTAPAGVASSRPTVKLLTNPRAGTLGVSLATGVLEPALAHASAEIGEHLRASLRERPSGAAEELLNDPLTVSVEPYRPLPRHTGLGLSAFYIALLTTFCGFLGGTIVHGSLDAALGYATTEVGPRWRQRPPVAISRWHTLLAKWTVLVPLTLVLTGLMLLAAVGVLGMDTPHFWELWLLAWFAASVIGVGTLTLFAALGTLGQIIALLVFVYLALASSGGTVPIQALSGFFRLLAEFEPLRQILGGIRSILYFNAAGDAGLTRAFVATAIGLGFWILLGAAITRWYDRKGLHRAAPELIDYIDQAARGYREQSAGPGDRTGVRSDRPPAGT